MNETVYTEIERAAAVKNRRDAERYREVFGEESRAAQTRGGLAEDRRCLLSRIPRGRRGCGEGSDRGPRVRRTALWLAERESRGRPPAPVGTGSCSSGWARSLNSLDGPRESADILCPFPAVYSAPCVGCWASKLLICLGK
jgi:hypothetical protein